MYTALTELFGVRQGKHRRRIKSNVRAAKPRRFQPLLERLEERDVPSTLSLTGPTSSTYGDQVTYVADLASATGPSGPANGTLHLIVDNVDKLDHALTPADFSNGDAVYSFSFSDLSATTHSIFATYDGDTNGIANVSSGTPISLTVAPRTLTVTATAQNKVYDGTTNATVTLSDNRVAGDTFTETFTSGAFSDKNVGNNKTVTVNGIAISGGASANYTLANTTATTTANITPRPLNLSIHAFNKVYDGTNEAGLQLTDDRLPGDFFTYSFSSNFSSTFSDKNVGTNKTVTLNGVSSIYGTDAGNYALTVTSVTGTASITPRPLTVSGITANDKAYDGTTAATLNTGNTSLNNVVSGDNVTLATGSVTAAFADKNVGTGKTVTINGLTLSGTDAGNYTVTPPTTTASITPLALTVTATGVDKTYDGTNNASVILTDNGIATDSHFLGWSTAVFVDKNAGTGKPLAVSGIYVFGADAGNYTLLNTAAATIASILPRTLTVTASAADRVYDGTTNASVTLSDNRLVGDSLSETFTSAAFSDKDTGSNKTVAVSGIAIGGPDAGNYSLASTTATTTASITQRTVSLTGFTANDKVYDGTVKTTVNTANAHLDGVIPADAQADPGAFLFNVDGAYGLFQDKNVGQGKTVYIGGVSFGLVGFETNRNYTLKIGFITVTANITPAPLSVTANAQTKVYGSADPTFTYVASGFVSTDTAATALSGSLSRAAGESVAGGPYAINQGTLTAGNYSINFTGNNLTITPAPLTVTANPETKVYGSVDPTLTYVTSGLRFNDTATTALSGTLSRAPGETVAGGPYAINQGTLTSNGNYTLNFIGNNLTITPAPLSVTANSETKVYGSADPTLTYVASGLKFSDTAATVLSGSLTRAPGETVAGGPYAITQGTLAANSNYMIGFIGNSLTITPAPLTVTADNKTRVYGQPNPALTASYSGFVNGDGPSVLSGAAALTTTATASSAPGSYPITAGAGSLQDSNYTFAFVNGTLTITPAPLTATGTTFSTLAGFPFTGVVATFANADPFGGPASYAATIAWGDGATSSGTIKADASGVFDVVGSHTYAAAGTETVRVTISQLQGHTTSASALSTAIVVKNTGLLLLDPVGQGALNASGGAQVVVSNNGVVNVDSSNAAGLLASGEATVQAAEFDLHGTPGYQATGGASLRGTIDSGVPLSQVSMQVPADLAALPVPTPASRVIGPVSYVGQTTVTLQPGTYAGIQASGQMNIQLAPGIYYLTGPVSISGLAQVTGQDVLLYFAPGSSLSLSGQGKLTLTPRVSGTYQGVAIFAASTSAVPFSITGSASLLFSGTIYAPATAIAIAYNGSFQGFNAEVIAADLSDSGSGSVKIQANALNRQMPLGDITLFSTRVSGSATGQFSVGSGISADPTVTDLALLALMQRWSSNSALASNDDALGQWLAGLAADSPVIGSNPGAVDLLFSGSW